MVTARTLQEKPGPFTVDGWHLGGSRPVARPTEGAREEPGTVDRTEPRKFRKSLGDERHNGSIMGWHNPAVLEDHGGPWSQENSNMDLEETAHLVVKVFQHDDLSTASMRIGMWTLAMWIRSSHINHTRMLPLQGNWKGFSRMNRPRLTTMNFEKHPVDTYQTGIKCPIAQTAKWWMTRCGMRACAGAPANRITYWTPSKVGLGGPQSLGDSHPTYVQRRPGATSSGPHASIYASNAL